MAENEPQASNQEFMYLSTSDVVRETGVTLRQLYYWESLGMFEPKYEKFGLRMYRRYRSTDVTLIKNIVKYLKEGFNLQTAARKAKDETES